MNLDENVINRENFLEVKEYLEYQKTIFQVSDKTRDANYYHLVHFMEWAGSVPFPEAKKIKVSFPSYLEGLRTAKGVGFAGETLSGVFKVCRAFLTWAKQEKPTRYKLLDQRWIKSLRPSRARSLQSELKTRELYTLEDVIKLVNVVPETFTEKRTRAAVAFLFLSGIRIGAFLTLPFECVDLNNLRIYQLPAKGVKTKNSKAAITYLLNIPELLDVVREYDAEFRPKMLAESYWYIHADTWGEATKRKPTGDRVDARCTFRDHLIKLCQIAGVKYLSAHKFRHGNAVYSLKKAKTVAQLKAISQNLMHSNTGITDGIYGRLVNDDVENIITGL